MVNTYCSWNGDRILHIERNEICDLNARSLFKSVLKFLLSFLQNTMWNIIITNFREGNAEDSIGGATEIWKGRKTLAKSHFFYNFKKASRKWDLLACRHCAHVWYEMCPLKIPGKFGEHYLEMLMEVHVLFSLRTPWKMWSVWDSRFFIDICYNSHLVLLPIECSSFAIEIERWAILSVIVCVLRVIININYRVDDGWKKGALQMIAKSKTRRARAAIAFMWKWANLYMHIKCDIWKFYDILTHAHMWIHCILYIVYLFYSPFSTWCFLFCCQLCAWVCVGFLFILEFIHCYLFAPLTNFWL